MNDCDRSPIRGVLTPPSVLGASLHDRIDAMPLDWRCKGFPLAGRGLDAGRVASGGVRLSDSSFGTPLVTLNAAALTNNLRVMDAYCRSADIRHAPHGKTTMAPQIFDAQLASGAWGITLATPWQARVAREFGVEKVLIANEVVDAEALLWMARSMDEQGGTILSYVDDVRGLEFAKQVLTAAGSGRRLPVLLELGVPGARTGVRTFDQARDLAYRIRESRNHRLAGIAGYEGGFGHSSDPGVLARVRAYLADIRRLAEAVEADGSFDDGPVILTAGGSSYFDLVADLLVGPLPSGREVVTIIRSGAVVSHDEGVYGEVTPFRRRSELADSAGGALVTAIEVWARVLSRPEPRLVLVDAGKRDVPYDAGLPSVLRAHRPEALRPGMLGGPRLDASGWLMTATNDQHGFIEVPESADARSGDLVVLGITHPCTLFDKWRALPVVDEDGGITDVVHTFF